MKFSPLDIYNKEFNKSTFGYNSTQVDEFLDEVGLAYERLLKDYSSLEEEKKRLEEKLENYESIQDQLEDTLNRVQRTVEEQTARARQEADRIRRQAEKEADNILRQARNEADSIKREARQNIQEEKSKIENLREQKELFKIRFRSLLNNYQRIVEEGVEKLDQAESEMIAQSPEGMLEEQGRQEPEREEAGEIQRQSDDYPPEEEGYGDRSYQAGNEPGSRGGNSRAEQLDFQEYDNTRDRRSEEREVQRPEEREDEEQREERKEREESRQREKEDQRSAQRHNPDLDDTKIKE